MQLAIIVGNAENAIEQSVKDDLEFLTNSIIDIYKEIAETSKQIKKED
jgi:hypothetical protein